MMDSNGGMVNHDPGPRPSSRRVTFDIAESESVAMEEDDPVLVVLKAKMSQLQICPTDCPMDGSSLIDSVRLFSGTSSTEGPSSSICPPYCIMNSTDSMGPSPSRTSTDSISMGSISTDPTDTVLPKNRSPLLASKIEQGYRKIKAKAARDDAQIEPKAKKIDGHRRTDHHHCKAMKCRAHAHSEDDEFYSAKTDFYEGLFSYSSESEMDRLLSEANPNPHRPTSPSTKLAITFGCLELSNSIPSVPSTFDYRPSSSCRKPPRPTIDTDFLRQLRDYLLEKRRDYAHMMRYKQQVQLRINECMDHSSGQNRVYLRKMASKATKLRVERTREIIRRRHKRGLGLAHRGSLDRDPPTPSPPPPPFSIRGGATCQHSKMCKKILPRKR